MAGRGHHPQPDRPADLDHIAVADRLAIETDRVGAVHQVSRADRAGQGQAAADVVVVDVRLGDMGDPDAFPLGQRGDAISVPLRIDDDGDLAVMGQVAPVAQGRRFDRQDLDHYRLPEPSAVHIRFVKCTVIRTE